MGEGSSQTHRLAFEVPEQKHHDRRDQELEHLHRLVRDFEMDVRGRHQRRNHDESPKGSVNIRDSRGEASYQSGPFRSRERSRDFVDRMSTKQHRHRSAAMDAMSRALRRVT